MDSFAKVLDVIQARVNEGKELPLSAKQAQLNLSRAKQRVEALQMDTDYGEASLAIVLGMTATDRVQPVEGDNAIPAPPATEDAAVEQALTNSKEIRRLQSQLLAKTFEEKSYQAARRPSVDLVAQYALLARYVYQDFFPTFQRNNGQLGVSVQFPVLAGSASRAQAFQAGTDIAKLRTQVNSTRERLILDTRKGYQDLKRSQTARDVAREDLDVARRTAFRSARADERRPRRGLRQVEEARSAESEKWIAFYESQSTVEKAELNLLRQTGTLMAALR